VHLLFLVVVALLVAWAVEAFGALALFAVGLRRARRRATDGDGDLELPDGPEDGPHQS
jgi:hypothetical protein